MDSSIKYDNKLLLALAGILIGLVFTFFSPTAIMLTVIILTGYLLRALLPLSDRRFLMGVFISAISVKIIILVVLYLFSLNYGDGDFTPDSRLYFLKSLDLIRKWTGQTHFPTQVEEQVGVNGYLYLLSFFYLLAGYKSAILNPVSLLGDKLINCLIGTLIAIPIFYIAKDIFSSKTAKIAVLLVIFFPSIFFWSLTNNRESINILLVSLIFFSFVRIKKYKQNGYFLLLLFCVLFLYTIREYIFFCILFSLIGAFLVFEWLKLKRKLLSLCFTAIAVLSFLNLTDYGIAIKTKKLNFNKIVKNIYIRNDDVVKQGGAVYKIYDKSLFKDGKVEKKVFFFSLAKGITFFMLAPFPWVISSYLQLLSYPQMILWYLLLPFVFIGLICTIRYRLKISLVVILYLAIVTCGFALIEGNMGSAMRHRDLVLSFYFIFGAAGLIRVFNQRALFDNRPGSCASSL